MACSRVTFTFAFVYCVYLLRMHTPTERHCQQHTTNTNRPIRSITFHKTCTNIFHNKQFATTVVQQTQHVDVVGCRTFFLAGWSAWLPLIYCKFLVGESRFLVRALRPPAVPALGARSEDITPSLDCRNPIIPPQISNTIDGSPVKSRTREYPEYNSTRFLKS